jgi:hypothetical protein
MSFNGSPDRMSMADDIARALDREELNIFIKKLERELSEDGFSSEECNDVKVAVKESISLICEQDFKKDLVSVEDLDEVTYFRKVKSLIRVGVDYTVRRALLYVFLGK